MTADGRPVATLPVARVLPLLQPAHLDREFDYLVPEKMAETARPGVRVRIRFAGRLVDGFVTERLAASDHTGTLAPLERVISDLEVLPADQRRLVDAVAHRYGGTRAEVLRLAVPPRHARAEDSVRTRLAEATEQDIPEDEAPAPAPAPGTGWDRYVHGAAFLAALADGRAPRAVWQALPGEDPAARLADAAAACVAAGRSAVLIVPDARVLARVEAACTALLGTDKVTALAAELGPSARYRRWLLGLTGLARVVVGTRAAVFAPVVAPGLIAVWDDGDDNLAEPRAPYPHAREVAVLRAHHSGAGLLLAGHTRTAEAQQLVEHGWAHDLLADRATVRAAAPHIRAAGDSEPALERDPLARAARIPAVAFAAARKALAAGAPVLVQVPRAGYLPVIACAGCKEPARCRRCAGPLGLPGPAGGDGAAPEEAAYPTCRWCGKTERTHRCERCGSRAVRASVVGAGRTAEELGRAFAGTPVVYSGGDHVRDEVPGEPAVVVSTVGAEPLAAGGYGAALLLDGWMLLTRPDLRATEQALRRWASAAALVRSADDGGEVVITAEPGAPTVQALIRWDPVGHARAELAGRGEVGFPPAVHIAAVDGAASVIADFVEMLELPEGTEVLGPVPLPPGERGPAGSGESDEPIDRILLRVPRTAGRALAEAVHSGLARRSAKRVPGTVRVQIDPLRVG